MEDTSKIVENTTQFVKSASELLEAISILLQDPISFLIFLLALVWMFLNGKFDNALTFFEKRRKERINQLESYLSSQTNRESLVESVVAEEREQFYFKVATGIDAKKSYRENLVALERKLSKSVGWPNIKKAEKFLVERDGCIYVRELTWDETISYYYNIFVALLFLVTGVAIIVFMVLLNLQDLLSALKAIALSVFVFLFAGYVGSQNWPINAANKIRGELDKIENSNIDLEVKGTDCVS